MTRRAGARHSARAPRHDVRPARRRYVHPRSIATSTSAKRDAPAHREVMQRMTQSRHDAPASSRRPTRPRAASDERARLRQPRARRVGRGERGRRPRARLEIARRHRAGCQRRVVRAGRARPAGRRPTRSGPRRPRCAAPASAIGERLTGWVAANRQTIVNSDAALDLGARAAAVGPRSRAA